MITLYCRVIFCPQIRQHISNQAVRVGCPASLQSRGKLFRRLISVFHGNCTTNFLRRRGPLIRVTAGFLLSKSGKIVQYGIRRRQKALIEPISGALRSRSVRVKIVRAQRFQRKF